MILKITSAKFGRIIFASNVLTPCKNPRHAVVLIMFYFIVHSKYFLVYLGCQAGVTLIYGKKSVQVKRDYHLSCPGNLHQSVVAVIQNLALKFNISLQYKRNGYGAHDIGY